MPASTRKRISVAVEGNHLTHIRNCLQHFDCDDVTVSPVMSGYSIGGYWSSDYGFARIGDRIMIRFTADYETLRPILSAGFGILASKVLQIHVTDEFPA